MDKLRYKSLVFHTLHIGFKQILFKKVINILIHSLIPNQSLISFIRVSSSILKSSSSSIRSVILSIPWMTVV